MTKVLLYWNHICVLHNEEKKHLAKVQKNLAVQGIDLEVRFFGLGYESHMCEYLAREDSVLPDLIVSADLEVFEQGRLMDKLGALHPCEGWMPLKDTPPVQSTRRMESLLPFVAIPLVCYTRDLSHCQGKTLVEMSTQRGFAFGGINNSAGKTITKIALQTYGTQVAEELLENTAIYDMPINAFQSVRLGQDTTALVPSLYALRQDQKTTFMTTLAEGALLLPSYFACRSSVSEEAGRAVMAEIISPELCQFYAQQGNLIICPEMDTTLKVEETLDSYTVVSQQFLDQLNTHDFYNLYTAKLPTAKALA